MHFRARAAIVVVLTALGCGGGGGVDGPPEIAGISVSLGKSNLVVGETTVATATPKDAKGNALTGRVVTWSSNDLSVATVTAAGMVSTLKVGTVLISATSEGHTGFASLGVTPVPVASVTVSMASTTISVGTAALATATLRDKNGIVLTGRTVAWTTSDQSVATVNSAGSVFGVGGGSASITATVDGQSGSIGVSVVAPVAATVSVTTGASTLAVGATTQAVASVKDANGAPIFGRAITWSTDNSAVATVSGSGVVTAVAPGTVNVVATVDGKSGSAAITILAQLGFGGSTEKIKVLDITNSYTPTLSGPSAGATSYASRATSVATVDAQGKITAAGAGQVWIAASATGWAPDSVYVIVPKNATGPILRTDLTTFNVQSGATTVVNVILDTRSTPIGGTELSVGITTAQTVFTNADATETGTPTPVISVNQDGVVRLSLASATPLSGQLSILRLTFTTPFANRAGFITLTLLDLVDAGGADLLPVATSTRIPIIVK